MTSTRDGEDDRVFITPNGPAEQKILEYKFAKICQGKFRTGAQVEAQGRKDREQVRSEVDMLLSELQVDYVDLLVADCPPEQVPAAWPWIEEVAREGRTRFLGVSNFDLLGPKVCVEVFRKFLAGAKMPPAVLAMEVHPLNTNEEMSDLCQSMGIQDPLLLWFDVLAYSPLGAPHKVETYLKVLTKSDAREMRPLLKVPELQLLQSIANRHDATAAQVALRWNLQRGHCIVPKSWNPNHILENTKLFSFQLTMEEMASITKLNKGVRSERFFQASFSTAAKALPQMTRDAHDECRKILNKIRGPGGSVLEPGSLPQGLEPVPLPEGVARRGGDDGGLTGKVDWEKLGFHRPVEEEPGFWRRMGLATGKGLDGKGKGKGGTSALLKDGLPVGGKGVPRPAMVGYRSAAKLAGSQDREEEALRKLQQNEADRARLEDRIASVQLQCDGLREELQNARARTSADRSLQRELQDLEAERDRLRSRYGESEKLRVDAAQARDSLREELRQLEDGLAKERQRAAKAERRAEELGLRLQDLWSWENLSLCWAWLLGAHGRRPLPSTGRADQCNMAFARFVLSCTALLGWLARGIMDPDEQDRLPLFLCETVLHRVQPMWQQEKRLAWKYLDCSNLVDERDRRVDWPWFRQHLLQTPYPDNMDAVFTVLNNLGTGSSNHYDEEARVCLMGVPAAFFYLTRFTLDTMERDADGRAVDAETVKKATLQYSVFENYISALHPAGQGCAAAGENDRIEDGAAGVRGGEAAGWLPAACSRRFWTTRGGDHREPVLFADRRHRRRGLVLLHPPRQGYEHLLEQIARLPRLGTLNLACNSITSMQVGAGILQSLEVLDLSFNGLHGDVLGQLA
eukprot:s2510_g1.t1